MQVFAVSNRDAPASDKTAEGLEKLAVYKRLVFFVLLPFVVFRVISWIVRKLH